MRFPLTCMLVLLWPCALLHAQPITLGADQLPALDRLNVEGKTIPTVTFTGKKDEVFQIPLLGEQTQWQDKGSLTLRLYNEAQTDGTLLVFIRDAMDDKSAKVFPRLYHWVKIPVDWTGWRDVRISFTEFLPSTGQIEAGTREVPNEISQIWLGNQIGPEDPNANAWGVPTPVAFQVGIESITVDD